MECPHLHNGVCLIATALAAKDVVASAATCAACCRETAAQAANRVTVSAAINAVRDDQQLAGQIIEAQRAVLGEELYDVLSRPRRLAAVEAGNGVGSQLWRLLASLSVRHTPACKCLPLAEEMNRLGPAGCRRERPRLVQQMRENSVEYGWTTVAQAAARALLNGLAWRLDLADVFGSLLDEAINLAERAAIVNPPASAPAKSPPRKDRQRLLLTCKLCPGDLLTMTAAIESLHRTYPGEYQTEVRTGHREIWQHNPWIEKAAGSGCRTIEMHYPSIQRCNEEHIPFLAGYTEYLGEQLGRPLRLRVNRPYLYLSAEEQSRSLAQLWPKAADLQALAKGKPIWLVNAGVKKDYTIKGWPVEYFQEVIDRTAHEICWVQIGLRKDMHQDLRGVVNLMDGSRPGPPMRETILLAYHAAGGLGPVTFLQHLCAAWSKPYICLVGGREPATWVQYPYQHTLHTVGALDCCRHKSCWRARVVPLNDRNDKDKSLCEMPITEAVARPTAACMAAIEPIEVLAILERLLPRVRALSEMCELNHAAEPQHDPHQQPDRQQNPGS